MAYTTINKSTLHFNTKLHTGNGGTNAQTGVGFAARLVWSKRSATGHHFSFDAVRGADKRILISDSSTAENSPANYVSSFDTDGFTLGSNSMMLMQILQLTWLGTGKQMDKAHQIQMAL